MQKLQQEQKEKELKKDEENRRRQQEESERLEAQKEKAQLEARKRRKIMESLTQLPLRSLPDLTPEKTIPPEKAMPSSTSSATASEAANQLLLLSGITVSFVFVWISVTQIHVSFLFLGSDQCCLTGTADNPMVL